MKLYRAGALLLLVLAACQHPVPTEMAGKEERATLRTGLAAEYFKRRQFGTAIEEANRALEISPGHAPAYNVLALVSMEIRDDAQARAHFLRALELAPADPDVNHNFGYFLCERGESRQGVDRYLQAVRNPLYTTPEKTLVAAGECAEKAGWNTEALAYYERALRYQPGNRQARYQLAALLLKEGALAQARVHALDLAGQPRPAAPDLWLAVRIEHKLGNRDSAQTFSNQLRQLYPDSLEASRLQAGQYD